jgi:nitroreductase
MNNPIYDNIKNRYSSVIFSSEKIEQEKLVSLFEAARWASSSYNEQPWRFILGVKNQDENYAKLFACLDEANKYWAKYAPVLVMSMAKRTFTVTGKPNRFAQHDTGMAVGNLLAQATSLGLYVHQMGGYSITKAKEHFELTDDLEPMAIMAIGYQGEIEMYPDDLQKREKRERFRKGLDEILF